MEYKNLILDHFQEEAIGFIDKEKSLIVSAPTGAGKTVIAEYAIEKALAKNQSVVYTSPVKALSNQKYRDFKNLYGSKVGIMTGDVTFNGTAPVIIMTTEIFRNALFETPERFDSVNYLIFDEVHYLNDEDRGTVWEESIIFAPLHIKVLCLSATIPNVDELAKWIGKVRQQEIFVVKEHHRPVPLLEFFHLDERIVGAKEAHSCLPKKKKKDVFIPRNRVDYLKNFHTILEHVIMEKQLPALYFAFSRKDCEKCALECSSFSLLTSKEQKQIKQRLESLCSSYKLDNLTLHNNLVSCITRGIAYHHAGMLPALKEIVEVLFTEGLIKLLFATETFALGVNMPAASVIFGAIKKFDGHSMRFVKGLEYQQMSGRAGRRGMDQEGYVYVNLSGDYITVKDLKRICVEPLDPVQSQFNLSYNTLLNLYEHLKGEILTASDKSFAAFQKIQETQNLSKKKKKHVRKKIYQSQRNLLKRKMSFLGTLGYVQDNAITSKGKFACNINGYEIHITELFYNGFFENKSEAMVFALLVAIIFEGKKGIYTPKLPKDVRKFISEVEQCISNVQKLERMLGIKDCIKSPDFRLTNCALAWASGKEFHSLRKFSSADLGDIVRCFRLAIQLLKQLKKACKGYEAFVILIENSLLAVNRDEVNALKQLEAFSSS